MSRFRPLSFVLALWSSLLVAHPAQAQEGAVDPIVVGTKEAPPFAQRGRDGEWTGLSIDLWERVALDLGRPSQYEERDLEGLLDATAVGAVDVAVAALTMTREREERMNFSHPYLTTGLAIAVDPGGGGGGIWAALFSLEFLRAVGALLLVLMIAGSLVWVFERRKNEEEFGGKPIRGLGQALWWSGVTMTTVGYGDKAPKTVPGRVVAFVWMFASIIIIATFTGGIASSLTIDRLASSIREADDLSGKQVAVIEGSIAEEAVAGLGGRTVPVAELADALALVESGDVDAAVHDAPILIHTMRSWGGDAAVLPIRFQEQSYAFALPPQSELREPVNRALLDLLESDEWSSLRRRYLGRDE